MTLNIIEKKQWRTQVKNVFFAISIALICLALTSCATREEAPQAEGALPHTTEQKITPADYADGELSYALTLSDGKRSVDLSVARHDGVTEAKVTSPETLLGCTVICDAMGTRLLPPNGESLSLTDGAAAGLRVYFDAMSHKVNDSEKVSEGVYRFNDGEYEVTVMLDTDGFPRLITVTGEGYTRHGEVRNEK